MNLQMKASLFQVQGLVQGVGFRPFIYRIAIKNNLNGWVENNNEGVTIHVEGLESDIESFKKLLVQTAPQASSIASVKETESKLEGFSKFEIRHSSNLSEAITEVSPDIAVCPECLADMQIQQHRIGYPFINCTNCGPRFTIIKDLPYDRHQTTMHPFAMCDQCRKEYSDILDRRFHAQPVACLHCGPTYMIHFEDSNKEESVSPARQIAEWIDKGSIIALKGLGGYHFVCDALNEKAVQTLRKRKSREGKPMAVMFSNVENIKKRFSVNETEEKSLASWKMPIVLLRNIEPCAPSVSNGMHTTGVLMPYMPLHHQLFQFLKTEAIVLTSGNVSDEPVTISDEEALKNLSTIADYIVSYNREIYNRTDDSVVFVADGKERLLRRSRGYVPSPMKLSLNTEGIFAAGAELVNTFAIGKGTQAILSQHIGDLKNAETLAFYEESFQRFSRLFRFAPSLIACDLHPDYLSTQFARSLGIETIEIQHHHAHIASCMAENGIDEKVIGVALDGTGLGDDGSIWGGEFFVCDLMDYERAFYFDPVPLPGGDKVTHEPWRTAVSYLYKYFGKDIFIEKLSFLDGVDAKHLEVVLQAIDLKINCPLSSGTGRLFDAVAALTGICTRSDFHAEAPMRLEAAAAQNCRGKYVFDIEEKRIVFWKLFYLILKDLKMGVSVSEISAKFHNTMALLVLTVAKNLRKATALNKIVLSGGTFQNRYLLEKSIFVLRDSGFEVFTHQKVPSNDGGIALGQLAIAAKRRAMKEDL
jgi:hydrogenase maturation protein HypF